jgi:hypothetical protein
MKEEGRRKKEEGRRKKEIFVRLGAKVNILCRNDGK